jgi:N-acyl-D-aspartate/D-glutamate deacylase
VIGLEPSAASEAELARMREIVREGLEAGALGLSTGLAYEPGCYASTDEIAALASELREGGGIYATHLRSEGADLLDALREAIEIGERAGVPVQISHHKGAGRHSWGLVHDSLRLIEEARARGVDIHADQYPYTASSTTLAQVVRQGRLQPQPAPGVIQIAANEAVIASAPGHAAWEGRSIADFAADWSVSPHDAATQVVAAEPHATVVLHAMSEEDVRTVMRHHSTMIGSDGFPTLAGKPHPRLYGTFARVLGRYARDVGLLSMEDAIHRMTGLPAGKLGLGERGLIRAGAFADLVVFDPATIVDLGSFADPHHAPRGVPHVFVNGTQVVRDGVHTGSRPGVTLR